jgi:hypothetical protein
MKQLRALLGNNGIRGVVHTADCEVIEFHNPGVKDLFILVNTRPQVLEGAYVADRVIGRGAALLLVMGHVSQVFAQLISEQAVKVLRASEINVEYESIVPNIINRDGTDICPVEKLTMDVTDSKVAFEKIKEFLTTNKII